MSSAPPATGPPPRAGCGADAARERASSREDAAFGDADQALACDCLLTASPRPDYGSRGPGDGVCARRWPWISL